jgi:hypothetical protein
MTPYRMSFYKGKRSYDLTEDSPDEEVLTTTSAEVDQTKPYPTPSRSPEASSSQAHLPTHTDERDTRPIKPLPRSESSEISNRAISSIIKTKVAIALLVEGKQNLNREKLCVEVSPHLSSILIADRLDWSF